MSEKEDLSVFLPFYNEEELVEEVTKGVLDFLQGLERDFELLLVDDGSSDSTPGIADEIAVKYDEVRSVHHKDNLGYGRALATGFSEADNPLIFYTDGDGQFAISQLEKFLDEIEDYDIVVGYREDRKDSFSRKLVGRGFNMLAGTLLPLKVRDVDCAFKLVRKEVLEDLELETQRTVDAELLAKASNQGFSIRELPVEHRERGAGESEASGILGVRPGLIYKSIRELVQIRRSIG